MMSSFDPIYLLLTVNTLVLAVVVIVVFRLQHTLSRSTADACHPDDAKAPEGADAVLCGFLDHRLSLMQARLDMLAVQPVSAKTDVQPQLSARTSGSMPFDYAVRIVQHGASAEDVMQACGLNRAEANLIKRIHGSAKSMEQDAAA